MATLHKKAGSAAPVRVFRAALRRMIADDNLPDYCLAEAPGDVMIVSRRRSSAVTAGPRPSADALDQARAMLPGADVYALEAEWRGWWDETGRPRLGNADAAFLGWIKTRG